MSNRLMHGLYAPPKSSSMRRIWVQTHRPGTMDLVTGRRRGGHFRGPKLSERGEDRREKHDRQHDEDHRRQATAAEWSPTATPLLGDFFVSSATMNPTRPKPSGPAVT